VHAALAALGAQQLSVKRPPTSSPEWACQTSFLSYAARGIEMLLSLLFTLFSW